MAKATTTPKTTRKPRATKATTAKAEPKTVVNEPVLIPATVKLCLMQTNGKGDINTKMKFTADTKDSKANIKEVVNFLADRLFDVFTLQNKIASKGGKSRLFKMTKGGKWYVDIDVVTENEATTLVSGLEFAFADLGTEQPKEVLQDVFEAWVLLNTKGTI